MIFNAKTNYLVRLVVLSVTATLEVLGSLPRSSKKCYLVFLNGNRVAPYYLGPKFTGELWGYIGTPLPNPSGNTGVIVCCVISYVV